MTIAQNLPLSRENRPMGTGYREDIFGQQDV